ncbi:thiamine biosynthesis lipoprotein [Fodinibius roseus]|uniref:FAD:protein FMN transferase n=1 Tax=Fodinibius roseus TaxID=1194090 RepID=A0A1M5K2W2_9BACT|nr:FAD:protein FMN transferase [Fodinibius roseus]SHG46879.1 thiamine biosynthesis lipoprotein [Fodinibius roseus]
MKTIRYGLLLLLPFAVFLSLRPPDAAAQDTMRYEFTERKMGTTFKITFYAGDDSIARAASEQAFRHVDKLNGILSDYEPESNVNKLSARSGSRRFFPVHPALFRVISKAQEVSRETDGAFDVTAGPFVKLWREIRRSDSPELPSAKQLCTYRKRVGYQHVKLDSSATAVALTRPGMQLDFGGIAKGYAADEILRILRTFDIRSVLVDAGGDIRLGDPPPGKKGWIIRIPAHNEKGRRHWTTLQLANRAVATSGDLFQHIDIDGKRYSHIIDPQTGLGLTNQSMVTIIAPDGITADSYASAVSVLGADRGISFIASKTGCALRTEFKKKGEADRISIRKSPAFDRFRIDTSSK